MDFPGTVSRDTKRIPRLGVLEPLVESWFHPLCLQLAKRLRWPTQASAWRPCLQLLHEPIPLTRGIIGQVVLGRDAFNPEGTAKLQRQAPACKPKRNDGHLLLALWHQTLCTMAVWSKARALPASEGQWGRLEPSSIMVPLRMLCSATVLSEWTTTLLFRISSAKVDIPRGVRSESGLLWLLVRGPCRKRWQASRGRQSGCPCGPGIASIFLAVGPHQCK